MEFGINLGFALKRWPEPERWARVVRGESLSVSRRCLSVNAQPLSLGRQSCCSVSTTSWRGVRTSLLKKANWESAGAADRVLEPRFDQDFPSLGSVKLPWNAPEALSGEFFNRLEGL